MDTTVAEYFQYPFWMGERIHRKKSECLEGLFRAGSIQKAMEWLEEPHRNPQTALEGFMRV